MKMVNCTIENRLKQWDFVLILPQKEFHEGAMKMGLSQNGAYPLKGEFDAQNVD